MRIFGSILVIAALVATVSAAEEATSESYVGLSGMAVLPQGGGEMRHLGGAALRGGTYLGDWFALEGEAAWLEDAAGLAAGGLWHFQGGEFYNRFFGYSRFDPFTTFGAKGWITPHGGQIGPKVGLGAFYHLTDSMALRADADATLGLDGRTEMIYSLSLGVQFSF